MTQAEKAKQKLAAAQAEIEAIAARQTEIESLLAQRWGQENDDLESEYVRNSAKLKAGQQVLENLKLAVEEAQKSDLLALLDQTQAARAAAAKQLTEADQKLLKAFEKFMAGPVAAWHEADTAHTDVERSLRGVEYQTDRAGIDQETLNEIVGRYDYTVQRRCWKLVEALQNVDTSSDRRPPITMQEVVARWEADK